MKREYIKTLAFGMALTCAVPAMAQNKVVQGTVLDDLGEPVIGAPRRNLILLSQTTE